MNKFMNITGFLVAHAVILFWAITFFNLWG